MWKFNKIKPNENNLATDLYLKANTFNLALFQEIFFLYTFLISIPKAGNMLPNSFVSITTRYIFDPKQQ